MNFTSSSSTILSSSSLSTVLLVAKSVFELGMLIGSSKPRTACWFDDLKLLQFCVGWVNLKSASSDFVPVMASSVQPATNYSF